MNTQHSQLGTSITPPQKSAVPSTSRATIFRPGREAIQPKQRVWAPLGAIALGGAVMFGLLWISGAIPTTPLGSLIGASLACAAGLIVISRVHYAKLLGRAFTIVVLLVFVVKIAIGVGHYLYFFEPNYFSQPLGFFPWIFDFGQLEEGMRVISAFWRMYGLVDVPTTQIVEKSWILAAYHALLYYVNGEHFLNFVPWASFHTLLVGFLITSLALQRGATPRQAIAAFILAGLQPLFLYTDLPQRDIVGQFFVVLAVYLLVINLKSPVRLLIVLPVTIVLVYTQRWAYPYVLMGALLLTYLLAQRQVGLGLVLLGIFVLIWSQTAPSILDATLANYSRSSQFAIDALPITSIFRMPAAFIVGIVGPFPWTQVIEVQDAFIHLPPTFLQAWTGVLIWLIVLPRIWRQWQKIGTVDDLALFSFMFALSGMITAATHTGYVHIATVLLLPMACQAPAREWARKGTILFYLYLMGHIVFFALGLNGRNLFIR